MSALDGFFESYYRLRPVNATFTGVHDHDDRLPDWSPAGLQTLDDEMQSLHGELLAAHPPVQSPSAYRDDVNALDAELARAFLEIQPAENAGAHGVRGNPSLWTGEAVFALISLMIRDFAPLVERIAAATSRLVPELENRAGYLMALRDEKWDGYKPADHQLGSFPDDDFQWCPNLNHKQIFNE